MKKINLLVILLLGSGLPVLLSSCGRSQTSEELLNQAFVEAHESNWKIALELAEKAAKRDERNISALVMYGIALEHVGSPEDALQIYRQAVKTDPENFYAQYHLGRLLYQQGKFEDSLTPLRQAEKLRGNDANTLVLLAQIENKMQLDSAINYYKKLAVNNRFKNKPEPWNQIGLILAAKGDLGTAGKCFAQAYRYASGNYIPVYNMAVFSDYYIGSNSARKNAIQYYTRYLQLTSTNPEMQKQRDQVINRLKTLKKTVK